MRRMIVSVSALVALAAGSASADAFLFTTASGATISSNGFTYDAADLITVSDTTGSNPSVVLSPTFSFTNNIEGVHSLGSADHFLFVLGSDATIGGASFEGDTHIYEFNKGVITEFADLTDNVSGFFNIDAISLGESMDDLFVSFGSNETLNGVFAEDGSVLRYNLSTEAVSVFIAEDDLYTSDDDGDTNAFHWISDTEFIASVIDSEAAVLETGGSSFYEDDDLFTVILDSSGTVISNEIYLEGFTGTSGPNFFDSFNEDFEAFSIIPTPGAGAMIAVAGLIGLRRHR